MAPALVTATGREWSESIMKTVLILIATAAAAAFIPPTGAAADPLPPIDWQELEDLMQGPGDHVVGDEICVQPR